MKLQLRWKIGNGNWDGISKSIVAAVYHRVVPVLMCVSDLNLNFKSQFHNLKSLHLVLLLCCAELCAEMEVNNFEANSHRSQDSQVVIVVEHFANI